MISLEFKRLTKNRLFQILFILFLLLMLWDPLSVYIKSYYNPNYKLTKGENPFQFWMLMSVGGLGQQVYNTLFWFFPLLGAGVFYFEYNSSMKDFAITRETRTKYFLSKISAIFIFYFLFFMILLLANAIFTYIIFPNEQSFTDQYKFTVPQTGTFASILYSIDPKFMVFVYSVFNALTLSIFTIFSISLQMILKFKNIYFALMFPTLFLYLITFIFDSSNFLMHYDIRLIIQPKLASVMVEPVTTIEFATTFLCWIFLDLILIMMGMKKNRDLL